MILITELPKDPCGATEGLWAEEDSRSRGEVGVVLGSEQEERH